MFNSAFPYIIWTPPYDSKSGGCKALHALAYEIKKKNYPVFITTTDQRPGWEVPPVYPVQVLELITKFRAISIYPEVVEGNPFKGKTVVRWLLNVPGKIAGPTEFPPEDLLYYYSKTYDLTNTVTPDRILHLPTIELGIFFNPGKPRKGICYYVGKGSNTPRIQETEKALEITRTFPEDPYDLADIFQTSELFITYDTATSLVDNARLCGCPVILIPGYTTKEEAQKMEIGFNGMGWGMEEFENAKTSMNSSKFRYQYTRLLEKFQKQLDTFIQKTQDIASKRF